jgi:hypothetical protein
MDELLSKAHAQLTHALSLVEDAQALAAQGAVERAGNLAHDADLQCLQAANTLSAAFGLAAAHILPRRGLGAAARPLA